MADNKTLALGSWSHGTLRPEDLAQTVLDMAASVGIEYESGLVIMGDTPFDALSSWLEHFTDHEDEPCDGITFGVHFRPCPLDIIGQESELIAECEGALQEYAPIYCYVGSSSDDPADFGVWLDWESLHEANLNGRRVDSETVINDEDGVRIHISDHGNVEVYALDDDRSLLALV